MHFLTPAERRAVVMLALLFALGAARDLWRATHPRELPRATASRSAEGGTINVGPPGTTESRSPGSADTVREGNGAPQGPPAEASGGRVDLNRATLEELDRLPGVGPVLARRIVEHRERHPFRDVDELLAVRGIGPKLLERLRARVAVGPP